VNSKFAWQELYQSALLELRVEDLQQRIGIAETAIQQRIAELHMDGSSAEEERHALSDALRMLRFLAITECKAPHSAALSDPGQAAS
jgi:hypothetical protein